jgi:hypothetical protein
MTNAHLNACPACSRHVRVTEASCPFCGVGLGDSFRIPAPIPLTVRLTRAARYAVGTGTLSLAAACGAATTGLFPPPDRGEGGTSGGGDSGYDAPPGIDASNSTPPYGGFGVPSDDAGTIESGTTNSMDAGFEDVFFGPPYGVPPP